MATSEGFGRRARSDRNPPASPPLPRICRGSLNGAVASLDFRAMAVGKPPFGFADYRGHEIVERALDELNGAAILGPAVALQ